MAHIQDHALARPNETALVSPDGEIWNWRQLNNASIALANHLHDCGVAGGDYVSIMMENRAEYLVAMWAALRLGVYITPINWHLKDEEVAHIVQDSGAVLVLCTSQLSELVGRIGIKAINVDEDACSKVIKLARQSDAHLQATFEQTEGQIMYYSSGTTGKPKGIRRPIVERSFGTAPAIDGFISALYGIGADTIYLSPAPLYHAAPLNWCLAILRAGGSLVVQSKFDPERFLAAIESYQITHTQLVPTMFVRLLALPETSRQRYSLASLKVAVHAAAPCSPEVKQKMLDWWGDIIYEYYGGSESNGVTALGPQEWRSHPGSVGKAVLGELHICDDDGNELGPNETGTVYFSGLPDFEYFNDPEKTRDAYIKPGWSTLGDIGYMDIDGFLYLTDRRAFTIVSGGVNIYPLEIENLLIAHDDVADVAVLGLPNEEFGEEIVAVIEPASTPRSESDFFDMISEYCRAKLASFKCPRRIILSDALPRMPNGKLLKRELKRSLLDAKNTSEP